MSFVPSSAHNGRLSAQLYESEDEEVAKISSDSAEDYFVGTHHIDVTVGEGYYDSRLGDTGFCELSWLEAYTFNPMELVSTLASKQQIRSRLRTLTFRHTPIHDEKALVVQGLDPEDMVSILPSHFNEVAPPVVIMSKPLRATTAFHDTTIITFTLFAAILSSIRDFASYVQQAPLCLYCTTKNPYDATQEAVWSVITYLYLLLWIFATPKVSETPPASMQVPVKSLDEFFVRAVKSLLKRAFGGFVKSWVFLLI
ncbi:hypothetical protein FRB98_003132 [Tulasnella sp. 332]|nr:hypothetical protein FRB98_003132 [Tulasnella sp. 332]